MDALFQSGKGDRGSGGAYRVGMGLSTMGKQGETRERRPSIGLNPPIDSKLFGHVAYLEAICAEGGELYEHEDPKIRWAASVFALRSTPLHEAPFGVARELVVSCLAEKGMPVGDCPDWLEELIDAQTRECQACWRAEAAKFEKLPKSSAAYRQAFPMRRSKVGHPPPKPFVQEVVFAFYLATKREMPPGTSENARYEQVAARLSGTTRGSQIDRHFVRRMVLDSLALLCRADPQMRDASLVAHGQILDILGDRDRSDGVAPESAASVRYFRT